jgi:hypothetical protein
MSAGRVELDPPRLDDALCVGQDKNQCWLRHSSRNFPLKLSMNAFSTGFPGLMKWSCT